MRIKSILLLVFSLCIRCVVPAQDRPDIVIPTGHTGAVAAIVANPSATAAYSLGLEGILKSWDMRTGFEVSSRRLFDGRFKEIDKGFLDMSPDGKYLVAATSHSGEVQVLDAQSMELVAAFKGWNTGMSGLQFTADSKRICITGINRVAVVSLKGEILLDLEDAGRYAQRVTIIPRLAVLSSDRRMLVMLYTMGIGGKYQLKGWDLTTGALLRGMEPPDGPINHISFSPDNRELLFAMGSYLECVTLGSNVRRRSGYLACVYAIAVDKGRHIFCFGQQGRMSLLRANDLSVARQSYAPTGSLSKHENVTAFHLAGESGWLFKGTRVRDLEGAEYGAMELWSVEKLERIKDFSGIGAVTLSAGFNPVGNKLLVGSADGRARLWDLQYGGVIQQKQVAPERSAASSLYDNMHYKKVVFTRNGAQVGLLTERGPELTDSLLRNPLQLLRGQDRIMEFSPDGRLLATLGYQGIQLYSLEDAGGKPVFLKEIPLRQEIRSVSFISGSRLLVCSRYVVLVVDLVSGQVLSQTDFHNNRVGAAREMPDSQYIVIGGGFTTGLFEIFHARSNRVVYSIELHDRFITDIAVSRAARKMVTASEDKTARIWDVSNPENPAVLFTLRGHADVVTSCRFSADDRFVVTTSEDKTTRLWSVETGEELCVVIGFEDDWIMMTPEGYYFASRNGARNIHFVKEHKTYSFAQYDLIYNRPDKVLARIGVASQAIIDAYRKAYEKRIGKLNLDTAMLTATFSAMAPQVFIQQQQAGLLSTDKQAFTLTVQVKDSTTMPERLYVRINGVPVKGRKGIALPARKSHTLPVAFDLGAGQNLIEVSAINKKGVESPTQTLVVNYTGPSARPNLYLYALGVSTYQDSTRNLDFAAKDARDVLRQFGSPHVLYGQVLPAFLSDTQVVASSLGLFKKQLQNSGPDDYVVFFYAGHGIVSEKGDFYLSPFDMDFHDPAKKGILFDAVEELMDDIGSRRKILFIDACNSGDADLGLQPGKAPEAGMPGAPRLRGGPGYRQRTSGEGGDNSFELMKDLFVDLRRSTGATAIASSSAVQRSVESREWKNGAFTYCLLKGLQDKAADKDGDGHIMLSELVQYVQASVVSLTAGLQRPVFRSENSNVDFRIW